MHGAVAITINGRITAFAVQLIGEAIGDTQHGVNGKDQRQAIEHFRVNVLFGAGNPPGALDTNHLFVYRV